jgi:hypothetical protein
MEIEHGAMSTAYDATQLCFLGGSRIPITAMSMTKQRLVFALISSPRTRIPRISALSPATPLRSTIPVGILLVRRSCQSERRRREAMRRLLCRTRGCCIDRPRCFGKILLRRCRLCITMRNSSPSLVHWIFCFKVIATTTTTSSSYFTGRLARSAQRIGNTTAARPAKLDVVAGEAVLGFRLIFVAKRHQAVEEKEEEENDGDGDANASDQTHLRYHLFCRWVAVDVNDRAFCWGFFDTDW